MKRIVNLQSVIDKHIGPLTPTVTRIMESIQKETHLMKVQWNGGIKYQVSRLFSDQCVVDVMPRTRSCRKWELKGIPYKHVVAACWNMALNDRGAPPSEAWLNPYYRLTTWRETYSHKVEPINITNYWEKSTCGNNVEASGNASEQAQQAEPIVGQHGSKGLGVGVVIDLSIACGQPGRVGVGVGSQSLSLTRWTKKRVQTQRLSP
ncbi:hypothetical protein Tco_1229825 [Tanacetum coccineum]